MHEMVKDTELKIEEPREEERGEKRIPGTILSPGIGLGRAILAEWIYHIPHSRISPTGIDREIIRFRKSLENARAQVKTHIHAAHGLLNEDATQIFNAHEMMLNDFDFIRKVERRITEELKNSKWAIQAEVEELVKRFDKMRDPYLSARSEDIRDLGRSLLESMSKDGDALQVGIESHLKPIFITRNLYPSFVMKAKSTGASGFATESSLAQSHAAIILKGMGIPVLGAVSSLYQYVVQDDEIIVDAINGFVIIKPKKETKLFYTQFAEELQKVNGRERKKGTIRAKTKDGTHIEVLANIEHPNQLPLVVQNGMEGIGLFRTEFLVLEQGSVPEEEKQVEIYRHILETMSKKQVVFRTFDIGGDKEYSVFHSCTGTNPALGVRGIRRHILQYPEELNVQLRSILRASEGRPVSILFPMVTNLNDVIEAKKAVLLVSEELQRKKVKAPKKIRMGAMIEVPSAAINTAAILNEVDFISIGTNDLLQYVTGADRSNPAVVSYYDPANDAFQWLLHYIMKEAKKIGRESDVTLCGEMSSSVDHLPAILNSGFRSISVSPVTAEEVRRVIYDTDLTPQSVT